MSVRELLVCDLCGYAYNKEIDAKQQRRMYPYAVYHACEKCVKLEQAVGVAIDFLGSIATYELKEPALEVKAMLMDASKNSKAVSGG